LEKKRAINCADKELEKKGGREGEKKKKKKKKRSGEDG